MANGYMNSYPYFKSASDFAEKIMLGQDKYENLWAHMEETKKILSGLKYEDYKDWVDQELIRFKRLKGN